MSEIFNLDLLKTELDNAEIEEDMFGNRGQSVYLGTVFNLYPSGKYYMPWASSNVEVCESCAKANDGPCDERSPCVPPEGYDGEEPYHCEVCKDMAWLKAALAELESIGAYLIPGDGDPCDLFANRPLPSTEDDIST